MEGFGEDAEGMSWVSAVCLAVSHGISPTSPEFSWQWSLHRTGENAEGLLGIFRISLFNILMKALCTEGKDNQTVHPWDSQGEVQSIRLVFHEHNVYHTEIVGGLLSRVLGVSIFGEVGWSFAICWNMMIVSPIPQSYGIWALLVETTLSNMFLMIDY